MKKIFVTLIFCTLAVSNSVSHTPENTIAIYNSSYNLAHVTYTEYIILKGLDNEKRKTYEIYYDSSDRNSVGYSVFGEWKISNDTLCLTPQYEIINYGENTGNIQSIYDKGYLDVSTIPRQFLIKEDSIIDVTDYELSLGVSPIKMPIYERKRLWGGNLWDYVAK